MTNDDQWLGLRIGASTHCKHGMDIRHMPMGGSYNQPGQWRFYLMRYKNKPPCKT